MLSNLIRYSTYSSEYALPLRFALSRFETTDLDSFHGDIAYLIWRHIFQFNYSFLNMFAMRILGRDYPLASKTIFLKLRIVIVPYAELDLLV